MVESHITVPRRFISADHDDDVTVRWGRWDDWLKLARIPEKYEKQGKRQLALSYYGKDDPKEDSFFSFATAKLSNLIWDSGGEPALRFCKFTLGAPIDAEMRIENGIFIRRFERGFVAVNPSKKPASTQIESGKVTDVFSGTTKAPVRGRLKIGLKPETGRVYLSASA